jgi:TonB family protein
VTAEEAPKIDAQAGQGVDASQFSQLSRLRYQQREQQRQAPQQTTLAADGAPVLKDAPGQPGLDAAQFQQLSRLRYQAGDRGQARQDPSRQALGAVADAPAPQVGGGPRGAAGVDTAALQDLPRLRYQSAAQGAPAGPAPSARAVGEVAGESAPAVAGAPGDPTSTLTEMAKLDLPGAPPPGLGAPNGDQSGGTAGPVNMVVAGVNPADRAPVELPRGSRAGSFSAGPNATPNGGRTASSGTAAAGLRAPNLAIQGQPPDAGDRLRSLTRSGGFEQLRPGEAPQVANNAAKPPIDPDMPFVGRPVYTLAINMPNVTSYRGDWVIQFAEALPEGERAKETEEERAARLSKKDSSLTPPYPVIKVDPKYSPDAVREQVEGVVVLYCVLRETGEMSNLQVVEGLDDRLDANAREAFSKWKFEPARKKGQPIAVETLIRIPFRLNPDVKIRY